MKQLITLALCLLASVAIAGFNDFSLSGFGLGGNNQRCQDDIPVQTITPGEYTFANTTTGKLRLASFTVTNTGRGVLTNISTSKPAAPFRVYSSAGCEAATLTAGGYCRFGVEYKPTQAVYSHYSIAVNSNQFATRYVPVSGTGVVSGSLLEEGFEGTGAPTGWTQSGTYDYDYTTAPAPLSGNQSLKLTKATTTTITSASFAATGDVWAVAEMAVTAAPSLANAQMRLTDGTNLLCSAGLTNVMKLRVESVGGTFALSTATYSTNTKYFIKWHYVKGSGANASCNAYISIDGTSWSAPISVTNGTSTTDATKIQIGQTSTNANSDIIVDHLRVSVTEPQ